MRNWAVSEDLVTSELLSEVSGELINHSEQRLGQTLQQSEGENIKSRIIVRNNKYLKVLSPPH